MGGVTLYRCAECGHVSARKRLRCRACKSRSFEELRVSEGELVAYTELYATRPGFEKPLRVGLVRLGEGVNALGLLETEPSIGKRVNVSLGDDRRIFIK